MSITVDVLKRDEDAWRVCSWIGGQSMSPRGILEAARIKIEEEKYWTQNAGARDAGGVLCSPHFPGAVKWCAVGACRSFGYPHPDVERAISILNICAPGHASGAIDVNDRLGHAAVLKMFDDALATFHD